jgi:4-hydroxy-2-oxoglutarate aldolase
VRRLRRRDHRRRGVGADDCVSLWTLIREGRIDEACALQRRLMPIARAVGAGHGVPGLKAALDLLGFAGGPLRPPLRPLSLQAVEIIRGQLDALGVGSVRT